MPVYVHPLRTFRDLAAFDLEAVVSCRCGRHGTIDTGAHFFRDRPIGRSTFRCTTVLPHWGGQQCPERHTPEIRKRGRDGWDLPYHRRAMMRRHPGAGGYSIRMIAFDEPPWDCWLDKPISPIVCPACRKSMKLSHTCGGHGPGGRVTLSIGREGTRDETATTRRAGLHQRHRLMICY